MLCQFEMKYSITILMWEGKVVHVGNGIFHYNFDVGREMEYFLR